MMSLLKAVRIKVSPSALVAALQTSLIQPEKLLLNLSLAEDPLYSSRLSLTILHLSLNRD